MSDQDQPTKQPSAMIFGNTKIHGPGDDSWFWGLVGPEPPEIKHFLELVDEWRAPGPDGKKERRYAAIYDPDSVESENPTTPAEPGHELPGIAEGETS